MHTYLQLINVRVPRNYEDNIPVDYESELRVSILSFKGSLTRNFLLKVFFHNSVSPGPLRYPIGNECLSAVSTTPAARTYIY